jgi:hypothetical protein
MWSIRKIVLRRNIAFRPECMWTVCCRLAAAIAEVVDANTALIVRALTLACPDATFCSCEGRRL